MGDESLDLGVSVYPKALMRRTRRIFPRRVRRCPRKILHHDRQHGNNHAEGQHVDEHGNEPIVRVAFS
jgi:hypothetical protein